MIETVSLHNSK